MACHLARTVPVDCLVCDRTFATLDATAARLMVSVVLHCSVVRHFPPKDFDAVTLVFLLHFVLHVASVLLLFAGSLGGPRVEILHFVVHQCSARLPCGHLSQNRTAGIFKVLVYVCISCFFRLW